ncbi:MAG: hypothetical protein HQK76_01680 [Desulfobacterales bacterium]|nr:hypothetical protein [Desulfobacterales bacterium]
MSNKNKKILIFLFFISFQFIFLSKKIIYADFKKIKLAVMNFQIEGQSDKQTDKKDFESLSKIIPEWLVTGLVKKGRFDVIERSRLEDVIKEQSVGLGGMMGIDDISRNASEIGRVLGAKSIVTGTVILLPNIIEINARIINVDDSSILMAESVRCDELSKLRSICDELTDKIVAAFPLEGYIVQRYENIVVIDLGSAVGVKQGAKFIVFKEGAVIKHPKTGQVLDIEKIDLGNIEIKKISDKLSTGIILSEKYADAIQYGMLVRTGSDNMLFSPTMDEEVKQRQADEQAKRLQEDEIHKQEKLEKEKANKLAEERAKLLEEENRKQDNLKNEKSGELIEEQVKPLQKELPAQEKHPKKKQRKMIPLPSF